LNWIDIISDLALYLFVCAYSPNVAFEIIWM